MKKASVLVAAVAAFAVAAAAAAVAFRPATTAEFDGKPELIAATFSSAWCSACKILEPRLAKAIPAFSGKPVRFVDYDLTFGVRDEIRAAAAKDGLARVFDIYAKATGYTVLVDVDSGEVIDVLTAAHSAQAIKAAIAAALAAAGNTPPPTDQDGGVTL